MHMNEVVTNKEWLKKNNLRRGVVRIMEFTKQN